MDDAAYKQAVSDHLDRVYSYAAWTLRDLHEAHDVAQEAFMRLWRDRAKVQPEAARPWLLKVAHHLCIDRARRDRLRTGDALPADTISAGAPPGSALLDDEQRREVNAAFAQLPLRDRAILTLTEVQGMSANDAARILDMRPGALRVAAHRARARLLELLQPQEAAT